MDYSRIGDTGADSVTFDSSKYVSAFSASAETQRRDTPVTVPMVDIEIPLQADTCVTGPSSTARSGLLPMDDLVRQPEPGLDFTSSHDYSPAFSYSGVQRSSGARREMAPVESYREKEAGGGGASVIQRSGRIRGTVTQETITMYVITGLCYMLMILAAPISLWFCIRRVKESEKMVLFRLGRMLKPRGPGYAVVFPLVDQHTTVSIQPRAFHVPPRKVITRDRAEVELGAELYYQVTDPALSVLAYQNLDSALRLAAQTCLTRHVSSHSLPELETGRSAVGLDLKMEMNQRLHKYGVAITKFDLSPVKVIRALAHKEEFPMDQLVDIIKEVFLGEGNGGGGAAGGQTNMADLFKLQQLFQPPQEQRQAADAQQKVKPTLDTIAEDSPSQSAMGTADTSPTPDEATGVTELLQGARKALDETLCREMDAVYQFNVNGISAEEPTTAYDIFYLDAKNGSGSVGHGPPPLCSPDVAITLCSSDLQLMLQGNLDPSTAYFQGRLEVDGSLQVARRLSVLTDQLAM